MRIFVMKKDTLIRIAAFAIIIVGAVFYTRAVANADEETFAESQLGVISCKATDEKIAAITIDTTFGEDKTLEILDVLDKHGAKATFAVMGAWAQENADIVREMLASGHEIISHSMAHERYDDIGSEKALIDAKAAKEYLKTEFGADTNFIRLPYGAAGEDVTQALIAGGFTPVKWSIDSKDWRGQEAEEVAQRVIDEIKPGSIIMFQNNNASTPDAIDLVLEAMGDRAYSAVSLSELIGKNTVKSGENA